MLFLNNHIQDYSEVDIERVMNELPEWRRDQALRFRHLEGKRQNVLAYLELCRALEETFGIKEKPCFCYNEHGKPLLSPPLEGIHFSLSHCRKAVGCVVDEKPCGLDIETLHTPKESRIRYTMNDEEVRAIQDSAHPEVAFIRLWTQKEAVLKLSGKGLAGGIKDALTNLPTQHIRVQTEEHLQEGFILSMALTIS